MQQWTGVEEYFTYNVYESFRLQTRYGYRILYPPE